MSEFTLKAEGWALKKNADISYLRHKRDVRLTEQAVECATADPSLLCGVQVQSGDEPVSPLK